MIDWINSNLAAFKAVDDTALAETVVRGNGSKIELVRMARKGGRVFKVHARGVNAIVEVMATVLNLPLPETKPVEHAPEKIKEASVPRIEVDSNDFGISRDTGDCIYLAVRTGGELQWYGIGKNNDAGYPLGMQFIGTAANWWFWLSFLSDSSARNIRADFSSLMRWKFRVRGDEWMMELFGSLPKSQVLTGNFLYNRAGMWHYQESSNG